MATKRCGLSWEARARGCGSDWDTATRIIRGISTSAEEEEELLVAAITKAEELLTRHWSAVTSLAAELYARRHLNADDIDRILTPFGLANRAALPKPKKKLRENVYGPGEAPFIADLNRMDGYFL